MSVERFRAGEYVEVPIRDPQGKWVRYSDYEQLQSRLAQVEQERDELRDRLAAEVAKRIKTNVEQMERSQKVSGAELEKL